MLRHRLAANLIGARESDVHLRLELGDDARRVVDERGCALVVVESKINHNEPFLRPKRGARMNDDVTSSNLSYQNAIRVGDAGSIDMPSTASLRFTNSTGMPSVSLRAIAHVRQ
jgi:hypothetical protein